MENTYLVILLILTSVLALQSWFLYKLTKKISGVEISSSNQSKSDENGPELNSKVPVVKHNDLFDNPVKIGGASKTVNLLFFISTSCEGCIKFVSEMKNVKNMSTTDFKFIVKAKSKDEVLLQSDFNLAKEKYTFIALEPIFELYNINSYPFFIAVDEEGKVIEKGVIKNLKEFEKYGLKHAA